MTVEKLCLLVGKHWRELGVSPMKSISFYRGLLPVLILALGAFGGRDHGTVLHACRLDLPHPLTGEPLSFESPVPF